jgi:poly(hydroxyalkanoate) depolymerase family esterase
MRPCLRRVLATLLLTAGALVMAPAAPAQAAELTPVTGFGSNPGNLAMYRYVPDGLPSGAALVVAMHGCTQSAATYFTNSGWRKYADLWGFALVLPEQKSANDPNECFTWFDNADITRGQGEALSIKQMVDYATGHFGVNPARVYVTGLSAGGAMTSVVLATYPDVFAGGAIIAGLPYRCATSKPAAYTCMNPGVDKSPAQWGDLVRGANPGYSGPWPRVAIWHGTSDSIVAPMNASEERDQWTNVWGVSSTPSGTDNLPGTSGELYNDSNGEPAVRVYRVNGMSHGTPVHPGSGVDQCGTPASYFLETLCSSYFIARAWGLDGAAPPPPGGPTTPTGLAVTARGDTTVTLSWTAADGASSYPVYRDGARVGTTTSTSYTDTGLTAGATYSYAVSAVNVSNVEGPRSASVSATTTGGGGSCVRANNYAHVQAGRAHQSMGNVYANGSNQAMGLYNVSVTHGLSQTGPNDWVVADSQC